MIKTKIKTVPHWKGSKIFSELYRINFNEDYPSSPNIHIDESIPKDVAKHYKQAKLVLELAPEASAALSRCCLEKVLTEKYHPKSQKLEKIIEECSMDWPSSIKRCLYALREIGNFAVHPRKDSLSGEIVEIEPGEAAFSLMILELAFDYFYSFQKKVDEIINSINEKLIACGKQPIDEK